MRPYILIAIAAGLGLPWVQESPAETEASIEKPWLTNLPPLPEIEPVTKAQID